MAKKFIFFTQSEMWLHDGTGIQELRSGFLEKYRRSTVEIEKRKEWKQSSDLKALRNIGVRTLPEAEGSGPPFRFMGGTFQQDEIVYAIKVENVGGMFRTGPGQKLEFEGHVAHYANVEFEGPHYQPQRDALAFSQKKAGWEEHIHLKKFQGNDSRQLTDGDSVDKFPKWDKDGENKIVYQTSGIARDGSGRYLGTTPWAINLIDLDKNEMDTVLSDQEHDYLAPIRHGGEIFFIRRPVAKPSSFSLGPVTDIFMLPIRIAGTLFHWMDFKSRQYQGKPLTGGDNPARNDLDLRQIEILGNLIKAGKRARKPGAKSRSLVPDSWQLVKQGKDGSLSVIRKGVIAFDIGVDGTVLYSTGDAVRWMGESGADEEVIQDAFVEKLFLD